MWFLFHLRLPAIVQPRCLKWEACSLFHYNQPKLWFKWHFYKSNIGFQVEYRTQFPPTLLFWSFSVAILHPPWNPPEYEQHLLENKGCASQNRSGFYFYLGAFNIWHCIFFSFHFSMSQGEGPREKKSGVFWSLWLYMDFISFVCSTAKFLCV